MAFFFNKTYIIIKHFNQLSKLGVGGNLILLLNLAGGVSSLHFPSLLRF